MALPLIASCSEAPPPPPEGQGQPAIVSLNPCSDAVLVEVADPEQIRALSHFSHDPAASSMDPQEARRFPAVGGSVEEVLALEPDVVVAGSFLPAASRAAFERLGMRVLALPIASSVEDSRQQVMELARLAGHPERGRVLNDRIAAALAVAAPAPGARPFATVVWQAGGIVPGENTLITDVLERTGFTNFSAEHGRGQADYLPLETMLADPPRVILAAGDARMNENRLLAHPALDALDGTHHARLDPSLLWCGGPTIIRAAERLKTVRKRLEHEERSRREP